MSDPTIYSATFLETQANNLYKLIFQSAGTIFIVPALFVSNEGILMKKILFSVIIFTAIQPTTPLHAYSFDEIRELKDLTAIIRASCAAINAASQDGASDELKLITGLSKELNKISANAIKEQSQAVRVARILERIATEAPWQKADLSDSVFYKKLTLAVAHCLARDMALSYKNKGVSLALQNIPNNRLVAEVTHALTKGLIVAMIDLSFAHIKSSSIPHNTAPKHPAHFFFERFISTATKDLAYRIAGEIVRATSDDIATRSELLADIFDPSNEENLF